MSRGDALLRLLWRPVTLAWVPLSALASLGAMAFGLIYWQLSLNVDFRGVSSARTVVWAFPALTGLLVGQAIKELQHCHFSWALPASRRRLLPGAIVVGLTLALGTREILTALAAPITLVFGGRSPGRELAEMWLAFPALSIGAVAVSFMVFWIGVRPSLANWIGVMAPLILFATPLTDAVAQHPVVAIAVTTPLTIVLIHRTFSISSARQRPFIDTQPLSGVGSRTERWRQPRAFLSSRQAKWRIDHIGNGVIDWVRAGVYENHGFRDRSIRVGSVSIVLLAAAYMVGHLIGPLFNAALGSIGDPRSIAPWALRGDSADAWALINLSPLIATPLSVLLATNASISLTRRSAYPLSRRQMARVEFWGSLTENIFICVLLTALLIAYWSFVYGGLFFSGSRAWPAQAGGSGGWVTFLLRPMSIVFLLTPITQLYRLRYLRAANGWSSVRKLLSRLGLMFFLTTCAVVFGARSLAFMPRLSLFVDGPLLLTLFVLTQVAYRHAVDRYFATADLV